MFPRHTLLLHHLRYNHFPPLPASLVPACEAAINALEARDPDALIDVNGNEVSAATVADACHLWDFVEQEEVIF